MNIRKTLLSGVLASSLALSGAMAFAQDSTPMTESESEEDASLLEGVPLIDAQGEIVARADIWEDEDGEGVWFAINSEDNSGLAEGMLGVHVHEKGVCDPESDPPFDSAGDHFNPTDEDHGDINADPSHAGDLGNLEVDEDGNFEHEVLAEKLTLDSGSENSLADEDGTALMIHSGEDDLETDPDGNAGDPWACGVIFAAPEEQGTPEATPTQDEAATPGEDEATPEEGLDDSIHEEVDDPADAEIDPMGGDEIDEEDESVPAD